MDISFAGAVRYFTGIDVKHSPCGRKLGFIGQLAYLGNRSRTLDKVISIAMLSFGVCMHVSSWYLIFKYKVSINFSNLASSVVNELFFLVIRMLPAMIGAVSFVKWWVEREWQSDEKYLIRNLGGQAAFNQLPEINNVEDEKELRHLEPSDVHRQPITKGVLADGRFFLTLHIQEKQLHQQQPVMTTLCQKKWFYCSPMLWTVLGHQKIALERGWFTGKLDNLRKLISGTHPTHELV